MMTMLLSLCASGRDMTTSFRPRYFSLTLCSICCGCQLILKTFGHAPFLVQVGPGGLDQGDQGVRGHGGDRTTSRNTVVPRQRKRSVKERNEAAEAFAHTALMKKKLQEARDRPHILD